jgi:hypothetical protein
MTPPVQMFADLKQFIGFTDADAANLRRLAPLFAEHGPAVTDEFYTRLAGHPETAALIAGRVDMLKKTHARWMNELFAGDYGDGYLENRWRVGLIHVRVGVRPHWVDAVASFLRAAGTELIAREIGDPDERVACTQSYLRILDLDMMLVDLAYGEERLDRLSQFTGMSRKLIERCVLQNKT